MSNQAINPDIKTDTVPVNFVPSLEQINAIARRMIPELKQLFADKQVQKEFAEWQKKEGAGKE